MFGGFAIIHMGKMCVYGQYTHSFLRTTNVQQQQRNEKKLKKEIQKLRYVQMNRGVVKSGDIQLGEHCCFLYRFYSSSFDFISARPSKGQGRLVM